MIHNFNSDGFDSLARSRSRPTSRATRRRARRNRSYPHHRDPKSPGNVRRPRAGGRRHPSPLSQSSIMSASNHVNHDKRPISSGWAIKARMAICALAASGRVFSSLVGRSPLTYRGSDVRAAQQRLGCRCPGRAAGTFVWRRAQESACDGGDVRFARRWCWSSDQ